MDSDNYVNFINTINDYIVSTNGIFKKITDDNNNIINIEYDDKMQKWIETINVEDKNKLLKKYMKDGDIIIDISEIKLSHYRSESDKILINSYGNTGYKMLVKFKDYIIHEKTLCLDDFEETKQEDIISNIKNHFNDLKQNYEYLTVYIYTNIYKDKLKLKEQNKNKIILNDIKSSEIQTAAGKK